MVPHTAESPRGLGHILRTYQRSLRTLTIIVPGANGDRIQTGVGKGGVQSEEKVAKSTGKALVKLNSKEEKYKEVVRKG